MGFSLEVFFSELAAIQENADQLSLDELVSAFEECIDRNRKYAEECGQIE